MKIYVTAEDLMSVQDAAKILGRPRITIYRWIKADKMLAVKLGGTVFIPRSEVDRILEIKIGEKGGHTS